MSSFWQFFWHLNDNFPEGQIKTQTGGVNLTKFLLLLSGALVPFYRILGCPGAPKCRGNPKKFLPQSSTESVVEKTFAFLQFCVPHLQGSTSIDGQVSPHGCVHKLMDTQSAGTTHQVTLSYTEASGCRRTGTYTVKLTGEDVILSNIDILMFKKLPKIWLFLNCQKLSFFSVKKWPFFYFLMSSICQCFDIQI